MAQAKVSRTTARKIKDKWKAKEWYKIYAPEMFNNVQIAETLSDSPEKLMGRIAEVTLQDLTGDFSKMHVKMQFQVSDVRGYDAHTRFIGHDLTSDYIRRLTRRKHSKMDGVFDVTTKDGYLVRIKPMAITEKRIQTSQQHIIRTLMGKVVSTTAGSMTLPELINNIIQGEMSKNIFKECKPIYPIKRIEIRKSEVMSVPANLPKEESKVKVEAEMPKEGAVAVSPEQVPPSPTEAKPETKP